MTGAAETKTTVVVIDDDHLVRAGIVRILESDERIAVSAEAADLDGGLRALREHRPNVALVDVRLGEASGLDVLDTVANDDDLSATSCLFLSSFFDDDATIARALAGGGSGFLPKSTDPDSLLDAIVRVATGEVAIEPDVAVRLARLATSPRATTTPQELLGTLTAREHDVLRGIATGQRNREIAEQLELSEGTVKTYTNRIFAKLGFRDRVEAVIFAYEHGLVRAGDAS